MTSTQPSTARIWLTPDSRRRLRLELADLLATDTRDADAAADQEDRRMLRRERIREIHDLLANAVVGQDPPDDGVAEPGMVLTVRYGDTGDVETFLLGTRATEDDDIDVYSPQSPLGAALTGAHRGEQRTYRVPNGGTVRVTLLEAVPYGQAAGDDAKAR